MNLLDSDKEIIFALADCNMKLSNVANKIYLSRNAIVYRADMIQKRTGLDPRKFYDLVKLVELASADR